MGELSDIKAVIVPSAASGVVLLTGAAELVAEAILELELEFDHCVREVDQDGAGVTCIAVDADEEPVEVIRHRIERALVELVGQTPELAGWQARVSAARSPCWKPRSPACSRVTRATARSARCSGSDRCSAR